jgi:hypothetical protein
LEKLKRDSSFMILWEQTQEKARIGRSIGVEEISKEENRRTGFAGEIYEILLTVESGRSCVGFSS